MSDRAVDRKQGSVVAAALAIALLAGLGCATSSVSNLDAYDKIAMNRVVPYPDSAEFRKRAAAVVIVDRESPDIPEARLKKPRGQVRRGLEGIVARAGATLIDRSLQDVDEIRTEGEISELEEDQAGGEPAEQISGADYALATRFSTYRYSAKWQTPFKFLWQSEEDVAAKPGTCIHKVDVEFDVQVVDIGSKDRIARTFSLGHSAEQSNKDLDSSCTIAPVTLDVLYENAIDEALTCLDLPLGSMLAPRGHVTEHRKAPEADRHIYRISLGSAQGIAAGGSVEVRREQRSMSPSGEEVRSERVVATGVVTDQVMPQVAWIALDPSRASEEILDGDIVRPIRSEGLLSSLSGPNCNSILGTR